MQFALDSIFVEFRTNKTIDVYIYIYYELSEKNYFIFKSFSKSQKSALLLQLFRAKNELTPITYAESVPENKQRLVNSITFQPILMH